VRVSLALSVIEFCQKDAGQRKHDVREVVDAVRHAVRSHCA
jgi:hypothetical protein